MQCEFVLLGADQLTKAQAHAGRLPTNDPETRPAVYVPRIWFAVQNIVAASANLSKLLWADDDAPQEDHALRAELRSKLGIAADSRLKSKRLRNQFEHYDEKVMDWHGAGGSVYVGRNVGLPPLADQDPKDRFAHYDYSTGIVTFFGHSASIPEIVAEARRILDLIAR